MVYIVDEDISRRTIALSIRTGKLTARALAWALRAAGRKIQKERQTHKTPHGRQSVKQLMKQGEATNSLPVEAPREFDRVARRWNVDYAFYKNGDGKYLLFFKSKQADAITACFGEYSRRCWTGPGAARSHSGADETGRGAGTGRERTQERKKEAVREER